MTKRGTSNWEFAAVTPLTAFSWPFIAHACRQVASGTSIKHDVLQLSMLVGGVGIVAGWLAMLSKNVSGWGTWRRYGIAVGIVAGMCIAIGWFVSSVQRGGVAFGAVFFGMPLVVGVRQLTRVLGCRQCKQQAS